MSDKQRSAEPKYSDAEINVLATECECGPSQAAVRHKTIAKVLRSLLAERIASRPSTPDKAGVSDEDVRDGEIEIRLFDSQWMNVVNHADCYADMSKEDAVAKAIKLTEVEMARNFHEDKWPKKAAKEQSHD